MNCPAYSPGEYTGKSSLHEYISLAVPLILRVTMVQGIYIHCQFPLMFGLGGLQII